MFRYTFMTLLNLLYFKNFSLRQFKKRSTGKLRLSQVSHFDSKICRYHHHPPTQSTTHHHPPPPTPCAEFSSDICPLHKYSKTYFPQRDLSFSKNFKQIFNFLFQISHFFCKPPIFLVGFYSAIYKPSFCSGHSYQQEHIIIDIYCVYDYILL